MSDNISAQQLAKGVPIEELQKLGFMLDPQEASNKWEGNMSILVAPPKVGKSTFLAQAGEKSFFIRMSPEFRGIKTWGENAYDLPAVRRILTKLQKAADAKIFPWENIVFDPMYRLMDYIADEVCEEAGNAPSIYEAGGFGVGQRAYKRKLKAILRDVQDLPAHKWFVFHSTVKELKETNDEKKTYSKHVIEMSEKLDFEITKLVDNTLHIMTGYAGTQQARTMVTMGTKFIEAGCKAPCLKKLPQISWGPDDKANYDKFRALFD